VKLYLHSPIRLHGLSTGTNLTFTLSPSSADVKNAWSYTANAPYIFMEWRLVKHLNIYKKICLFRNIVIQLVGHVEHLASCAFFHI
jgi:hypothetical protein